MENQKSKHKWHINLYFSIRFTVASYFFLEKHKSFMCIALNIGIVPWENVLFDA